MEAQIGNLENDLMAAKLGFRNNLVNNSTFGLVMLQKQGCDTLDRQFLKVNFECEPVSRQDEEGVIGYGVRLTYDLDKEVFEELGIATVNKLASTVSFDPELISILEVVAEKTKRPLSGGGGYGKDDPQNLALEIYDTWLRETNRIHGLLRKDITIDPDSGLIKLNEKIKPVPVNPIYL